MISLHGVGIDFGTTNTVVAVFDGKQARLVPIDGTPTMPSATYISKTYSTCVGNSAVEQYLSDNRGRRVALVPEKVGQASLATTDAGASTGNSHFRTHDVYSEPRVDANLPGRLFRGVKRLLGQRDAKRFVVFEKLFRPVALITPILARINEQLYREVHWPDACFIGRPVHYEGKQPYADSLALSRMAESIEHSGFDKQEFIAEPIAAATNYLFENSIQDARQILVVDFGGGTLDLCVLKTLPSGAYEVVVTHGIPIGGDHIDQAFYRDVLFPLLGEGQTRVQITSNQETQQKFPFDRYTDYLLNWGITYLLNQNQFTAPIYAAISQAPEAVKPIFERLRHLIQYNLSYDIFRKINDVKVELSTNQQALFDFPELDLSFEITRAKFEATVAPFLEKINDGIKEILKLAELEPSDISVVLRTGGSSQIPAFTRLLEQTFPHRIVPHDPFNSVAKGLAMLHYKQSVDTNRRCYV